MHSQTREGLLLLPLRLQLAKQLDSREDTVGVIVTEVYSRFSFWLLAFTLLARETVSWLADRFCHMHQQVVANTHAQ